jgi:hypothetical protein
MSTSTLEILPARPNFPGFKTIPPHELSEQQIGGQRSTGDEKIPRICPVRLSEEEGKGGEGISKTDAHVGYEDDAQEQVQALLVLVFHLLRPLLRHGCAPRGSSPPADLPPSACAGNLGILVCLLAKSVTGTHF